MTTLREHLSYEPRELQFGTSGRRGLVADLTQLEIYINALAEVRYLQTLADISSEKTSTIVFPLPIDLIKPFLQPRGG